MRERLIELLDARQDRGQKWSHYENGQSVESLSNGTLADYLLANGVIVPPCDIGTEIKGEIVNEVKYYKCLASSGEIHIEKKIYTCNKADVDKKIYCSHPMSWEEAENALKDRKEDKVK